MDVLTLWIPLLFGSVSVIFILTGMQRLSVKSGNVLEWHRDPRVFIPLVILGFSLFVIINFHGLTPGGESATGGEGVFEEFGEKDPGQAASLAAGLIMIFFSALAHWRTPHFWKASFGASAAAASLLTLAAILEGFYQRLLSFVWLFGSLFLIAMFLGSLVGSLSFFRKRRENDKKKAENRGKRNDDLCDARMKLRPELLPRYDSVKLERAMAIGSRLTGLAMGKLPFLGYTRKEKSEIARLLEEYRSLTGKTCRLGDFDSNEEEEVGPQLDLMPEPRKVSDITDEELCELIRRIREWEGSRSHIHYFKKLVALHLPAFREESDFFLHPELLPAEVLALARSGRWR